MTHTMSTQTRFLRILLQKQIRILWQKQISCDLRIFRVNLNSNFYLCKKIDIMQLCALGLPQPPIKEPPSASPSVTPGSWTQQHLR